MPWAVVGLLALIASGCSSEQPDASSGADDRPSWLEPCDSELDPVVRVPPMTFAPEGLRPIRTSSPRAGLVQVVGQMESTVPEESKHVTALAEELGLEELFAENEGTDAEYSYSDGETLYLIAMRQICEGRLEMRFNEEKDPAAEQ